LLYNICIDAKVNVPDNYNGYNLNTYMKYWQDEPEQAISDMMKLFETLGEKAPAKFLKRGDIVVIKYKDSKFPSIYVGNNNIMMATREQGVIVLPLGKRFQVIMARRLI
jgi:cell wall-associated NlpC family hydrolase